MECYLDKSVNAAAVNSFFEATKNAVLKFMQCRFLLTTNRCCAYLCTPYTCSDISEIYYSVRCLPPLWWKSLVIWDFCR